MNTNYKNLIHRIGGFVLGALMLSGIVVASSTSAEAQWRRQRRVVIVRPYRPYRPFGWGYNNPYSLDYRYRQYVFSNSESAVNQGYSDGYKTGSEDGQKHKSYNPERSHYFQEAGFGNFAEAFRDGFIRGYRDGYGPS
jgi:hypothetical protein